MKTVTVLAALLGLLLGIAIVGYYGFGTVVHAMLAIRLSGFLIVCAYHLLLFVLLGVAWYLVVPAPRPRHAGIFVWGRLIRDAGSDVLPFSQLGGFVMGARAVTLFGISGATAVASTVVDVTLELLAQLAYTALGLLLLIWMRPDAKLAYPVAIGLVVALAGAIGFIFVQRRGLSFIEPIARNLTRRWLVDVAAYTRSVRHEIDATYHYRPGLKRGLSLHLLAWIGNGGEAWVALHFMGVPLSLAAVLAIESLLYAIRSLAFLVPNAAGVQEGAYVMLGGLFGLPPDTALALSLLKRARDLAIGIPALATWQALESGKAWRRRLKPE
jgi:putative membrane protein